jgi:hypothetical protein
MWERLYPYAWYVWGGLFVVFEFVPIAFKQDQYTLSEYIWRVEDYGPGWTALRYFIAAICVWLFFHLVFGWFR